MSGDASAGTREAETDDYEEMLATLDVAIAEARRKVDSGRVYDAENEKVRIKWIRALAYAVNVRRQVTTDRDLEELTERIEQLEATQETHR
jgi:ribosomal protein L13E